MALLRNRLFPFSVFGPVLLSALRRLASICLGDAMTDRTFGRLYLAKAFVPSNVPIIF